MAATPAPCTDKLNDRGWGNPANSSHATALLHTLNALTITGTNFLPGTIPILDGAQLSNIVIVDENTITMDVTVEADTPVGAKDVLVALAPPRARLSIDGEPLYYFAIAGRKKVDVPDEFLESKGIMA